MDQSSDEKLSLDDAVGLLATQNRLLSTTLDGLVRVLLSRRMITEREVEAINADAMHKVFGWSEEEDADEMAGADGDVS